MAEEGTSTRQLRGLQRKSRPLPMPVLAIGGEESSGEGIGGVMELAAADVQSVVIPGAGHWLVEEAPEALLAALTTFLAPYRDGAAAAPTARPVAAAG
jgi:pimeloyl-ACP methyl ester carboxylesterase